MSTPNEQLSPAQNQSGNVLPEGKPATATRSLASHALAFIDDGSGIRVPVTEISLEPSPNGDANPPFRTYRTAGPGSDPVRGLPPFRAAWIAGRGDTEAYSGRGRNLLDDGRSAVRRGAASAEWNGRARP
ncbi:phosphomethylpyrimidine synthase ThiC, partial [Arthrobacter nitrophenolicus]